VDVIYTCAFNNSKEPKFKIKKVRLANER